MLGLFISCGDNSGDREYGNTFGGIGRSSSFENVEEFQAQLYSQKILDSAAGASSTPLLLRDEQMIFSTDDGRIISSYKSEKKWEYKLDSGSFIGAGFAADDNNNIYTIDILGKSYSLDSTGKLRHSNQLFQPTSLEVFNTPLTIKDRIVYATSEGNLVITDKSGKEVYRKSFGSTILDYVSAVDANNILLTLSNNQFGVTDTIVSITPDGKENWRFSSNGYRFIKGAISNGKNIAVAGTKQGGDNPLSKVFYLDNKGKSLWEKEISTIPRFLSIANDGEVYLVSYSSGMGQMLSGVYSYSIKGELTWKIYYQYSIPMPVYISQKEIMFIASNRETYGLFYLQRGDGTLIKTLEFGEVAPIIYYPEVGDYGTLIFAGKKNLRLIRVDETPINKLLPY